MIESWFSSPIYVEDNVDKENIKTYKKHIKKYALQTNFLSNSIQNREGIHTSHELIDLVKDPIFTPLKTHILKHNKIFLSALGYDEKTIAGMRISNMWFNVVMDNIKTHETTSIENQLSIFTEYKETFKEIDNFTLVDDTKFDDIANIDDFRDYLRELEGAFRIPTKWGTLNKWTNGGFMKKTLNTFMAPTLKVSLSCKPP